MKKNSIYLVLAVIFGLLVGWVLFGGSQSQRTETVQGHDHSSENLQMWTCSMHPQIMQPEPGDCPICGMDLIPAESDGEGMAMNEIKMTKNAMALANIETTRIGKDEGRTGQSISLSGRIKVNEENEAIQASYFDGRIERLNVSYEGQEVKKGQLLATIYAPSLVAAQQELISSLSLKESQPALYKAVRNKLKLWKLSDSQINAIEETKNVKEFFPLYATVSGTVSEKLAAEGDYVKQGQPILKLINLESVWAEFDVYESQISFLKEGQKVLLTTNAYPNKEVEATISFINPVLNASTRTVPIRATLNNQDNIFKPGMFVKGNINGAARAVSEELIVPASAIMWTGERSIAYVKLNYNEPVFEMREVLLGSKTGDSYSIMSGLEIGDEVVINGAFTIDAAAQLQGKNSMMNQNVNADGDDSEMGKMKMTFPSNFQENFKSLLPTYLLMKDVLIDGEGEKVKEASKTMYNKIIILDVADLKKMEKAHFMGILESLKSMSSSIDIKVQREEFVKLNQNMVPIMMNMGKFNEAIYVQKCPMINNNRGAFWLSTEKQIRNPYYGDQMMTCGSIIDSIQ